jgi:pimeloyl-ACP methyl ester carboxylesterase
MEMNRKNVSFWLVIATILMLISMVFASLVQTSGGTVTIKDLIWETQPGFALAGHLFIPDGVSAEQQAPAIVTSHGMFNNRQMQDANFVELSRRGYVVLAIDMPSHGFSDNVPAIGGILTGMYEAVKKLASLDYVDSSRIGITGHSLGGWSANAAVVADSLSGTNLISAVLLNSAEPTYTNQDEGFSNIYGSRNVGVIAAQYDEFFMTDTDENGNPTSPRDYVQNRNAQSFLFFGTDPTGRPLREPDTIYEQRIDGETSFRVIYSLPITHPWSHFSKRSTSATIEFFEKALGAPNPIPAGNQVWQWKEFFNLIGLIGFAIFVVNFTILMVFTPFFSSLRASKVVEPRAFITNGKQWFWGTTILGALFATLVFLPILSNVGAFTFFRNPWPQSSPWGIGSWAAVIGLFTVISLLLNYYLNGKKHGINLADIGIRIDMKNLAKTIVLSLIVTIVSFGWVFFADFFFKTDFRIWVLAVKTFNSATVLTAIYPYALLFLIFYVTTSMATNSFNYNTIGMKNGKGMWINTAIVSLFITLPPMVLMTIQYVKFFTTGFMAWSDPGSMFIVWLIPLLVILPVTTIISRKIYRVTNNPYLGGIINGLIVTLITSANTLTWA